MGFALRGRKASQDGRCLRLLLLPRCCYSQPFSLVYALSRGRSYVDGVVVDGGVWKPASAGRETKHRLLSCSSRSMRVSTRSSIAMPSRRDTARTFYFYSWIYDSLVYRSGAGLEDVFSEWGFLIAVNFRAAHSQ